MKIQIGNMYGSILRIAILNSELNNALKLAGKKRLKLSNFSHILQTVCMYLYLRQPLVINIHPHHQEDHYQEHQHQ